MPRISEDRNAVMLGGDVLSFVGLTCDYLLLFSSIVYPLHCLDCCWPELKLAVDEVLDANPFDERIVRGGVVIEKLCIGVCFI